MRHPAGAAPLLRQRVPWRYPAPLHYSDRPAADCTWQDHYNGGVDTDRKSSCSHRSTACVLPRCCSPARRWRLSADTAAPSWRRTTARAGRSCRCAPRRAWGSRPRTSCSSPSCAAARTTGKSSTALRSNGTGTTTPVPSRRRTATRTRPGESRIRRRYSMRHRFEYGGRYEVRFRLLNRDDPVASARAVVELRGGRFGRFD